MSASVATYSQNQQQQFGGANSHDPAAAISMTAPDDEGAPQFFVRALFDFTGNDASSLSFRRGDIIEVLNTLPSGWWDGLLDDERGWFPSNYVQQITDQEAEREFSERELLYQQQQQQQQQSQQQPQQPQPTANSNRFVGEQHDDRNWIEHNPQPNVQPTPQSATILHGVPGRNGSLPSGEYWMPQMSENGQVCILYLFHYHYSSIIYHQLPIN